MENKLEILKAFEKTLHLTGYACDILALDYEVGLEENVVVRYTTGKVKRINVKWDSGFQMIKDIINHI